MSESKIEKHNKACNSAAEKLRNSSNDNDSNELELFTQKHIDMIKEEAKDIDPDILRRSLAVKLIESGEYEKAREFMTSNDKDLRQKCFVVLAKQGNMNLAFSFLTKEETEVLKNDLNKEPHPPSCDPPSYEESVSVE